LIKNNLEQWHIGSSSFETSVSKENKKSHKKISVPTPLLTFMLQKHLGNIIA
jgi:hypothetical protein